MRVEVNQMVWDEADPICTRRVSQACGQLYAFLEVLDTGMDGQQRYTKRYWGPWSWEREESCTRAILENGGKWPRLPEAPEGYED